MITDKVEKAIAAYIRGHRDERGNEKTFSGNIDYDCTRPNSLEGVPIVEGRSTERRGESIVLVLCNQNANRLFPDLDLFEIDVEVSLITHRHDDTDNTEHGEALHAERVTELHSLLLDEVTILAAVNKPSSGIDTRDVKQVKFESAWLDSYNGEVGPDGFLDTFVLKCFAYPFDT